MRRAFTLIELLVVIGILALLMGLLFPALIMVRESVRRSQAVSTITNIQAALENYRMEDLRHDYPPALVPATPFLRCTPGFVEVADPTRPDLRNVPAEVLDMLHLRGMEWNMSQVDIAAGPSQNCLLDPWQRPYRYQVDDASAATPPAPPGQIDDWNVVVQPNGTKAVGRPFAYVWSIGRPTLGKADADPVNAARWIHRRSDGPVR